jgi:hypothetical protein
MFVTRIKNVVAAVLVALTLTMLPLASQAKPADKRPDYARSPRRARFGEGAGVEARAMMNPRSSGRGFLLRGSSDTSIVSLTLGQLPPSSY